jgi:signal transduction histidine kinase
VNLHNGEVRIDSRAGGGTTVTCRIPTGTTMRSIAAAE